MGKKDIRPNALVEWAESTADSWSAAPPGETNRALAHAHRSFAKRARELQPVVLVLSHAERERLRVIANVLAHNNATDSASFLRDLISRGDGR